MHPGRNIQKLVSLPEKAAAHFSTLDQYPYPEWIAASDPKEEKLGSGGGTAHLLYTAWTETPGTPGFTEWIRDSFKLIIHGGGEGRRLPAYAPMGKLLTPMPVWRWSSGQRLDQNLLDLQLPVFSSIIERSPSCSRAMIASGDVLIDVNREIPDLPEADVVCVGLWVEPAEARNFGVFFCPKNNPGELDFFLQKPTIAEIRELSADHLFLVDTGIWLLSEKALSVLMAKCGWNPQNEIFADRKAARYALYGQFGLSLGTDPTEKDPEIEKLTSAVAALPEARFRHFGKSLDLIRSSSLLQNAVLDQTRFGSFGVKPHPDTYLQNARVEFPLNPDTHTVWIENSHIPGTWELSREHVITNVPANDWMVKLEPGICLDSVPVGDQDWCVRAYGIRDDFRGEIGSESTQWLGQSAPRWFKKRGLSLEQAGIPPDTDLQKAALFPVAKLKNLGTEFIQWIVSRNPVDAPGLKQDWLNMPRLSADELSRKVNFDRLLSQRRKNRQSILPVLRKNHQRSIFYRLDLQQVAIDYADSGLAVPPALDPAEADIMKLVHDHMFRSALLKHTGDHGAESEGKKAFEVLRRTMIEAVQRQPAVPEMKMLEDQIVWGRSPVRLDLAGGWTDTPPYCLLHGGAVVNLACELNGQPPIQAFVKPCRRKELVLRSIDRGAELRITTQEELRDYSTVGDMFSIPKAALALAGFLPEFSVRRHKTLDDQLSEIGGGLEVSLLAAIPKGSGLGTSSILAATLLGTLSEALGLCWDTDSLISRTLVLEQMLTTGGGWQDQVGGLLKSVKSITTRSGFSQKPTVRWLPEALFSGETLNSVLLYYTGITRRAKDILQEIVRGMFLNSRPHLRVLGQIARHAETTCEAIRKNDWDGLCRAVDISWQLNQRLDSGTNPPAVQQFLGQVEDWLSAVKLLGAGGGGYVLMLAKDEAAAQKIRAELTACPPNPRARFVDMTLSETGLQITRN